MNSPFDAKLYNAEKGHGWAQLFRLARAGVPHATDILQSLYHSNLTFPGLDSVPQTDPDLHFYSTVHHANRNEKLILFLEFMLLAKKTPFWENVRESTETQLIVIDVFLRKKNAKSILEAIQLVPTWLYAISPTDNCAA